MSSVDSTPGSARRRGSKVARTSDELTARAVGRMCGMDLRIFTEPQAGATYEQQLTVAQTAERLGFDAFFRSDHFLSMSGEGLPGPTESWVTLGAIARETTR